MTPLEATLTVVLILLLIIFAVVLNRMMNLQVALDRARRELETQKLDHDLTIAILTETMQTTQEDLLSAVDAMGVAVKGVQGVGTPKATSDQDRTETDPWTT